LRKQGRVFLISRTPSPLFCIQKWVKKVKNRQEGGFLPVLILLIVFQTRHPDIE